MEAGFLRDRRNGSFSMPAEWIKGVPEKTWFGMLKIRSPRLAIESFRCEKCGFLEQYANGPQKTSLL
jgi:hypothetical protein